MLRQELITTYTWGQIYTMNFRVRTDSAIREINVMWMQVSVLRSLQINPLNAEFNSTCHLLALLGAHPILHVNRIRVKGDAQCSPWISLQSICCLHLSVCNFQCLINNAAGSLPVAKWHKFVCIHSKCHTSETASNVWPSLWQWTWSISYIPRKLSESSNTRCKNIFLPLIDMV
jgi:hypothetical protein